MNASPTIPATFNQSTPQALEFSGAWTGRGTRTSEPQLDALPIVGLLSFLLGVVVAFQGASQFRQYGANIFVADLVGLSMLREFAPLMTAIIIACTGLALELLDEAANLRARLHKIGIN